MPRPGSKSRASRDRRLQGRLELEAFQQEASTLAPWFQVRVFLPQVFLAQVFLAQASVHPGSARAQWAD
jgi:hypothetical protein